jgi:small subunit ribosomal protein S19e
MANIKLIEAGKYNVILAEALKKAGGFEEPEWVRFVKTGSAKKRPSIEDDFWFKRSASILRQIYINEIVGVGSLRTRYGGRKNRGMEPARFRKSGGKIIRVILQQAENAGMVEKVVGKKAGRKMTDHGKKFLEEVSGEASK